MTLEITMEIGGKEHKIIAHGCMRSLRGELLYSDLRVLDETGAPTKTIIDMRILSAIRARLLCAYIAQVGVRDANETSEVGA